MNIVIVGNSLLTQIKLKDKTKVVIFRKGGRIPNDIAFLYDGKRVDVVNKFNYLGVVFSSGGSFSIAQSTISGQPLKASK